jgi:hypothetical protein
MGDQWRWPLFSPVPSTTCSLILLVIFLVIMPTPTAGECELQDCWNLYQSAQETLGDRDYTRFSKFLPEELRVKCVSLRTFYLCIRNISRNGGCLGNLNFHSAHKGAEKQMKFFNCTTRGETYTYDSDAHRSAQTTSKCSFTGKKVHKHCSLFGDPHLRTFRNQFQTCKVHGAWPLVDNQYLTVQVTNDAVLNDSPATAISKLTVMIKRQDECASSEYLTYQAQTDYLPGTFENGLESIGPEGSVKISEIEVGKHVEIYLRYIDTTVVVRQIGRYFTFAIKMPEEIVNKIDPDDPDSDGIQLCTQGCPRKEQIDYKEFLAQKHSRLKELLEQNQIKMGLDAAVARCQTTGVIDFYFDSCVFDLMTTGDSNFTLQAYHALQDIMRLNPQEVPTHQNRTSLELVSLSGGAPSGVYNTNSLLLLLTCCAVTITRLSWPPR